MRRIPVGQIARLQKVEGWFTWAEAKPVMAFASEVEPPQTIVEIGAYAGRSTCMIATAADYGEGAHVTTIDPWLANAVPGGTDPQAAEEILQSYLATLTELELSVTTLRARGEDVASMWVWPVGLLFIDASHLYEDTLSQIESWEPHLPTGAHVALHDHHRDNPGVIQAVSEVLNNGFKEGEQVGTLKVLTRE